MARPAPSEVSLAPAGARLALVVFEYDRDRALDSANGEVDPVDDPSVAALERELVVAGTR